MSETAYRLAARSRRYRRAFTLVEILTVVIILGIVAAMAVPDVAQQQSLTATSASRVVLADLLYAQSQAIATQQTVYVSFSVNADGAGSYSLCSPLSTVINNPVSQQPYTQLFGLGASDLFPQVSLASVTLDAPSNTVLAFNEIGQPMVCSTSGSPVPLANTGSIVLQCGSMSVTLSIEPGTGNLTVSSPQGQ
jgi:prepilin-type N-terminal cleavage/methylation domain-containing protein